MEKDIKDVMEKGLTVVRQQTSRALSAATELSIEKKEDLEKATDLLSKIKQVGKIITDRKKLITDPINKALKEARALFAPLEDNYEEAERIVKSKMVSYQREEEERARKEQEKIAKKVDSGKLKFETAAKKIEAIDIPQNSVEGDKGGKIMFKEIKELVIIDEMEIPREYLVVDMIKLRKEAFAGKEIPGVKVEMKKIVSAR